MLLALGGLCAAFVFGVHRPSLERQRQLQAEIEAANEQAQSLPLRLAELTQLGRDVDERLAYIDANTGRLPAADLARSMPHHIAAMAERLHLADVRVQPLDRVEGQTFERRPFSLTFRGEAADAIVFLAELERGHLQIAVDRLSLTPERAAATLGSRTATRSPQEVSATAVVSLTVARGEFWDDTSDAL